MRKLILLWLLGCTLAHAVVVKADAPKEYVVQHGDTLWGIANRFLEHPWEWKALWEANPKIKNPSKLYPGAIISLRFHHKQPWVRVLSNGTVKLSPAKRPAMGEDAIPPIPLSDIKPFLNESLILDEDKLNNAPYVVAFSGERLRGGQGDEVYVRCLHPSKTLPTGTTYAYALFRQGKMYTDKRNGRCLGYMAEMVGYGELVRGGEPAALVLTSINKGVRLRDRVMPDNKPEFDLYFLPRAPSRKINGHIIDIRGDYTQGGIGLVVVLDKGRDCGLKAGDVLGIYSKPRLVPDPIKNGEMVTIPPERIGEVMVFRPFTHTSFALIVRSLRAVYLEDLVTNP